jgi:hypothetical protein
MYLDFEEMMVAPLPVVFLKVGTNYRTVCNSCVTIQRNVAFFKK